MHALKLIDTKPRAKYATALYLVFMRTTDSGIMLNTTAMKLNFQSLCLIMTKRIAGKGIKLSVNLGKADPQVNIKNFQKGGAHVGKSDGSAHTMPVSRFYFFAREKKKNCLWNAPTPNGR